MAVYRVSVKWAKEKYDDVPLDTAQSPADFKVQLYSLTGVPPERQKVMVKGGLLKDDSAWDKLDLKDGFTFMLMGTADAVPQAPAKQTVFIEDMTEQELNKVQQIPAGLENLGNTCYMNATLQTLHGIPELTYTLLGYTSGMGLTANMQADPHQTLTVSLRDVFRSLEGAGTPFSPMLFLQVLRLIHPQFAQQQQGRYSQQDAEECWGQIVTSLAQKLKLPSGVSFVQHYFGLQTVATWKCKEGDEPETTTSESANEIKCHITKDVSLLYNGLKEGLTEDVEKVSPVLGRTAIYTKTSRVTRLPSYLTVNFVRFFWRRDTSKKAKILKKVAFPLVLDMYDFCTDDLKHKLEPMRARFKKYEDAMTEARAAKKRKAPVDSAGGAAMDATLASSASASSAASAANGSGGGEAGSELSTAPLTELSGENLSGYYELHGVLTHIGRSSDSGHYMAWIRDSKDTRVWWKFDDEKVSTVTAEEVLKLDGGGDWHMAYLCIYRERQLPAGF